MRAFCEFSKVVKVNGISTLDKHSMPLFFFLKNDTIYSISLKEIPLNEGNLRSGKTHRNDSKSLPR